MNFQLHPKLAEDCVYVGDLAICRVLLMNNRHFPWLVLVPKRENLRELFDLTEADYPIVMTEIRHISQHFTTLTAAHKINIAALGNMVPQLHIHIIARYSHDNAWPQPVWNSNASPEPYPATALANMIEKISRIL